MAPRSNWKGYLKLSLVSASIAIYPATSSSEKVRFNTLNRATGNRLKRQMVDAVTGDIVETDDQIKGYAVGKDQYVQVEDEELANVAIESTHMVEIEKFVPKVSIDDRYRDTPYYLAPEDKVGQEAFAVVRDAMKKKKMVGIGRVVMARRERLMMLEPFGHRESDARQTPPATLLANAACNWHRAVGKGSIERPRPYNIDGKDFEQIRLRVRDGIRRRQDPAHDKDLAGHMGTQAARVGLKEWLREN